jgi:thiaminase
MGLSSLTLECRVRQPILLMLFVEICLLGDHARLSVALAACLLGYGEIGLWLKEEARAPNSWVRWDDNPYLKWMEDYSGDDYQKAVKVGLGEDAVNLLTTRDSDLNLQKRLKAVQQSTRLRLSGSRNGEMLGKDVLDWRRVSGTWR